jgi:hypothetical protein
MIESEPRRKISKRGRQGERRPSKRTPEVVATIAAAIATGLTDEEASLLAGINPDTVTEWRKDPEFSGADCLVAKEKENCTAGRYWKVGDDIPDNELPLFVRNHAVTENSEEEPASLRQLSAIFAEAVAFKKSAGGESP